MNRNAIFGKLITMWIAIMIFDTIMVGLLLLADAVVPSLKPIIAVFMLVGSLAIVIKYLVDIDNASY